MTARLLRSRGQVLVVHALTGSADAAGNWCVAAHRPRLAFDTDRVGVCAPDLLGGRYGSTGPTSSDPSTDRAYRPGLPDSSPARDQARATWLLLDVLGIDRLALVRAARWAAWSR